MAAAANLETSDSATTLDATNFYRVLQDTYRTFGLPLVITENGISDGADALRPAYIVEHLTAVAAARRDGVPIAGFIEWTLSDHSELADGYCSKYGVVAVDRASPNLTRTPRQSFFVYQEIATTKKARKQQHDTVSILSPFGQTTAASSSHCVIILAAATLLQEGLNMSLPSAHPPAAAAFWCHRSPWAFARARGTRFGSGCAVLPKQHPLCPLVLGHSALSCRSCLSQRACLCRCLTLLRLLFHLSNTGARQRNAHLLQGPEPTGRRPGQP